MNKATKKIAAGAILLTLGVAALPVVLVAVAGYQVWKLIVWALNQIEVERP